MTCTRLRLSTIQELEEIHLKLHQQMPQSIEISLEISQNMLKTLHLKSSEFKHPKNPCLFQTYISRRNFSSSQVTPRRGAAQRDKSLWSVTPPRSGLRDPLQYPAPPMAPGHAKIISQSEKELLIRIHQID